MFAVLLRIGRFVCSSVYDVVLKIYFLSCDCVCNYYHTTQICSCKRLSSTLLKRYLCCCAYVCVCASPRRTPHATPAGCARHRPRIGPGRCCCVGCCLLLLVRRSAHCCCTAACFFCCRCQYGQLRLLLLLLLLLLCCCSAAVQLSSLLLLLLLLSMSHQPAAAAILLTSSACLRVSPPTRRSARLRLREHPLDKIAEGPHVRLAQCPHILIRNLRSAAQRRQ